MLWLFKKWIVLTPLKRFLSAYYGKLGEKPYRHVALHEGNDMRGIDVAVAAHDDWPFYTRSHADLTPSWVDNTASGEALLDQFPKSQKQSVQTIAQADIPP